MYIFSIFSIFSMLAVAGSGGPDAFGVSFIDNNEPNGPPFAILDLSNKYLLSISGDELEEIELPFPWWWYDAYHESVMVSTNGVLFFSGETADPQGSCPGDDPSWSGIAAFWDDWDAVEVRWGEFGYYPYRTFAVEWSGTHAVGGYGAVQAWLMEGGGQRPEVAIILDDITFGDASVDAGASAYIGVQHHIQGTGVPWACGGSLQDISAAWFGRSGYRVSAAVRQTEDLLYPWMGTSNFQYFGRSLAAGDLNADGLGDLLIGNQDDDQVFLFYGQPSMEGQYDSSANVVFSGSAGSDFGTTIVTADLDNDGFQDVVIGTPEEDGATSSVGAIYGFSGSEIQTNSSSASAQLQIVGATNIGSAKLGRSIAVADVDADGYQDILVGGHQASAPNSQAGIVYLWSGSADILASQGQLSFDQATAAFTGETTSDWLGYAMAAGDMDGDQAAEFAVGAPLRDTQTWSGGSVYLMAGGSYSGTHSISTAAVAEFSGTEVEGKAGYSLAIGDTDADGAGDLIIGAPFTSTTYTQAGATYVFFDALTYSGPVETSSADVSIYGESTSARAGQNVQLFDVNGDAEDDLLIAAPNAGGIVAGGGAVGFFTSVESADSLLTDADFLLYGSHEAGGLGTAMAQTADADDDEIIDVFLAAPYADSNGWTMGGRVYRWFYGPDFIDEDNDGFVPTSAGGIDCDDGDAAVYPSAEEVLQNGIDDDCDGWVDDFVMLRERLDLWIYETEALGMMDYDVFDFEDGVAGDNAGSMYSALGLSIFASDSVMASDGVFGSASRDQLAAKVYDDGTTNQARLYFADGIEALFFYVLDGDGEFTLSAESDGNIVFENFTVTVDGDNVPGGRLIGLVFAETIDYFEIETDLQDGFGLDNIGVVWAAETDSDGDGFTEVDGDCNDDDATIHPQAVEDLSNGIDDDCDGAVDGGNITVYDDNTSWENDASLTAEQVDFEALIASLAVTTDYEDLGVLFDGGVSVEVDIDGAAPIDSQAALAAGDSFTLTFDELQPAVAFYGLDVAAELQVQGYASGVLLYDYPVTVDSENVAGGAFVGLLFDHGVDELIIENTVPFDQWGIDNLTFSALGLDDADGDGYTEADGDCDDDNGDVNPDAVDTWYDGIDSDCAGNSDFDADGDGHVSSMWGGSDCADDVYIINPDAEETWYDGVDQDCDGWSDFDADFDGHESSTYTYGAAGDCNDGDGDINPDAEEIYYDEVDSNCEPDDEYDADGDGYASAAYAGMGFGGVGVLFTDCDDEDGEINPDAEETWYDGIDSDCDEGTDFDADLDGFESLEYGGDDCDDSNETVYPGAPNEAWYDGIDTNCDGLSDFDQDGDGYDISSAGGLDCDDTDAAINPDATEIARDGIDQDCDGALEFDDDSDGYDGVEDGGNDCDDTDPAINPGATEIYYDDIDQNCDNWSDYDADMDSYDSLDYGGTDCDDSDGTINPGAVDYYYDGIDNDCDGLSDFDQDGDGYPADWYGGDDCDDTDASIHPAAAEQYYDGVDQNCDGFSDYDADEDGEDAIGFGGDDCDDTDASVLPLAIEIPLDGIDQNCDGVDDIDADGDGFWYSQDCNDNDPTVYPGAPDICYDDIDSDCLGNNDFDCDGDMYRSSDYGGIDCDDADANISPAATEVYYDGVDQNCDGLSDYDADGDGYDGELWGGEDCEDLFDSIHPGQPLDDCGGGNEDCDDELDEDCEPETEEPSSEEEPSAEPSSNEPAEEEVGEPSAEASSEPAAEPGDETIEDTASASDDESTNPVEPGELDDGADDQPEVNTSSSSDPSILGNSDEAQKSRSCGCSSANGGAWAWLMLAVVWVRRQRIQCDP